MLDNIFFYSIGDNYQNNFSIYIDKGNGSPIAHLHDEVMHALHSGSCSQTPGKFKNNGATRSIKR